MMADCTKERRGIEVCREQTLRETILTTEDLFKEEENMRTYMCAYKLPR